MYKYFLLISMLLWLNIEAKSLNEMKILHLTFHKGCQKEFESVAKEFGFQLDTWYIQSLPTYSFDGTNAGNGLYNVGHDRAQRVWDLHKNEFNEYDAIITSDTAPLARIFLQNNFSKPLIIWICNRFDYSDRASLDCKFPDSEYYDLWRSIPSRPNVAMIGYTDIEHVYTKSKGVESGTLLIKPCGFVEALDYLEPDPTKGKMFYLPPYHNETKFMNFSQFLNNIGIENRCGRYSSPRELTQYKGIIHLPYSWSNLAFFENISLGIVYFIPTFDFMRTLYSQENYFFPNPDMLFTNDNHLKTEWYHPDHSSFIVYFSSWEDLNEKINLTDFENMHNKTLTYAKQHRTIMLDRWKQVFSNFGFKDERIYE